MKSTYQIFLIAILMVILCLDGKSQPVLTQRSDISTRRDVLEVDSMVAVITEELMASSKTDHAIMKAIYTYVIEHIQYDTEAYKGQQRRINQSNADVLQRGRAVCWGYSELIREMCEYADIPCVTVTGYSKGLPYTSKELTDANHAWNAVQLDGRWYLVDATWGSGVRYSKDFFTTEYGEDYYLTPPGLFVLNHLPLMPMWQLLECPVSLEAFVSGDVKSAEACDYNYEKEIETFLELSQEEQIYTTIESAYALNDSENNRVLKGHSMVDLAIVKKEDGDTYFDAGSLFYAINSYEEALLLFRKAKSLATFYSWQEEAYIFAAMNRAQAYYRNYYESDAQNEEMQRLFMDTRNLADKLHLPTPVREHVINIIAQYLKALE